jgi:hypothetical protein
VSERRPCERNLVDKQVSLKKVLAVLGTLVILGGTFYAGMLYEDHRIASGIEDAFGDLGEEYTEVTDGEAEETPQPTEAEELKEGSTVKVETENYDGEPGEMSVTLKKVAITGREPAGEDDYPDLTRFLRFDLKVENTGTTVLSDPSFQGHFESEDGKVYEFSGFICDSDDMPTDELQPGKYVEGCNQAAIPEGAGKFVFDSAPFYIPVAAS